MIDKINPLVTIGLTTYNRPDFLIEAVHSVLNQKYKNFKLIIGNDFPESKVTFAVLGIDEDPRIEIINFKENIGEINNLNYLLSQANSEWFTWLADDDVLSHYFLDSLIKTIKHSDQNVCAVYSEFANGEAPDKFFFDTPHLANSIQFDSSNFIADYVQRKRIRIIGSCGLLNTNILKAIGGFPNLNFSSGIYGDGLLPILLAQYGKINLVTHPLVFLRTHEGSLSASLLNYDEYISAEPRFLIELSRICLLIEGEEFKDECVYHMLHWFAKDAFFVLFRLSPKSKAFSFLQKSILLGKFLDYQFKVNYPRLKIRFWIPHTFNIIKIIVTSSISMASKYFKKL